MSRSGLLWTIIALIVIAGVAFWLLQPAPDMDANVGTTTGSVTGTATGQPTTSTSTGSLTGTVTAGTATGGVSAGGSVTATASMAASVSYSGSAFSPKDVTVKKGGTVTWTSSNSTMWVASASHPTHTVYAGTTRTEHCPGGASTAFDQCAGGQSYSFTFDKVGTWNYHDHMNASAFGSVTVVE